MKHRSHTGRIPLTTVLAIILATLLLVLPLATGCSSGKSAATDQWIFGLYSKDWINSFYAKTPVAEQKWVEHAQVTVGWSVVEPQAGVFDWSKIDATVDALRSHGVKTFCFTLDKYLPAWAGPRYGPPANLDDWRGFVRAAAEHYKGTVEFYQIWNEPSRDPAWKAAHNSPYQLFGGNVRTDYPPMLEAAYQEIKAVDKDAVVICAALNDELGNSVKPEDGTGLYREMLGPGYSVARNCDAIAVHPYYQPEEWGIYYGLIQDIVRGYGLKQEVVVTEIGWMHNIPNGQEVQRAAIDGVGIGPLVERGCKKIWVYTDLDDPPDQRYDFDYGLFDYQGNPVLAWNSFKDWVARFRGSNESESSK